MEHLKTITAVFLTELPITEDMKGFICDGMHVSRAFNDVVTSQDLIEEAEIMCDPAWEDMGGEEDESAMGYFTTAVTLLAIADLMEEHDIRAIILPPTDC